MRTAQNVGRPPHHTLQRTGLLDRILWLRTQCVTMWRLKTHMHFLERTRRLLYHPAWPRCRSPPVSPAVAT